MVLFLDSGIGGLPYCRRFLSRNPRYRALYFADREGFPYGSKTREELSALVVSRIEALDALFHPELAVLACNTASVSALDDLRLRFPRLPFVGTVPAVKPAVEASGTGVVGVLGTERTVEDGYIDSLASRYGTCRIVKLAAPELVAFVEHRLHLSDEGERTRLAASCVERFRKEGADGIVLGCTHFLFLADEFRKAAAPDITVYDSVEGVVSRAETLLGRQELPCNSGPSILLAGGEREPEEIWRIRAEEYGMELRHSDGTV